MSLLPQGTFQNLNIFRDLKFQKVSELTAGAKVVYHRHREIAFPHGAPAMNFAIVLSGCYKLYKSGPSSETILSFATQQEPIGILLMANPTVYPVNVEASTASSMLVIPQATYLQHWLTDPEVMKRVQGMLLNRCKGFHYDRILQTMNLKQKVGAYLLKCIDQHSVDGKTVPFPLSRKEIGEAVGASEESVIRVMSAWEKAKVISTIAQSIEVLDLGVIAQVAQGALE